jgi:hypothetical protein
MRIRKYELLDFDDDELAASAAAENVIPMTGASFHLGYLRVVGVGH